MGEVYRARDTRLGREVAVKVLPEEFGRDPERRQRFEREARAASALSSPHIVTLFDIGQESDVNFFVTELIEGTDLRALVGSPTLTLEKVLDIAGQIAAGLVEAHEKGIVHRDLKPENVLVSKTGSAKIADFGLAKLSTPERDGLSQMATTDREMTIQGVILGTLPYMSPEQARGEPVDFRSDQFALGSILYELLTGVSPFKRATAAQTLSAVMDHEPPTLAESRRGLPMRLEKVVRRCLAKDREERYHSTKDLARDLLEAIRPVSAPVSRTVTAPPSATIGRSRELEAVRVFLGRGDVRLLTLTGPAGIGKTRLAVQAAHEVAGDFPGGVEFVSLASVSDPSLLIPAIAKSLGIGEETGRSLKESLREHLAGRVESPTLLVLDNFEHLVSEAGALPEMLDAAPEMKLLVTSRSALRLYGEQEFPVPPLAVPSSGSRDTPERLKDVASVEFFLQRARTVKPDFSLTSENASEIADICRRLEGLPLALELAAARVKLFSPRAILGRLEKRLDLLTGGPRDSPGRQQTLRAAIDWSHELLDEPERRLFRRVSVFRGGCTLEAVEAVCNARDDLEIDVLEGVASLCDKSLLLRTEGEDEEPRFAQLETIREFGAERLENSAEEESVRRCHSAYFLILAEEADAKLMGSEGAVWYSRLKREEANFRAAADWLTLGKEPAWGLRLGAALLRSWERQEYFSEGREQLERLLAVPGAQGRSRERARALLAAGILAYAQGDIAAGTSMAQESLVIFREIGDRRGCVAVLNDVAVGAFARGDFVTACPLLEEALSIWSEIGDRAAAERTRMNLADALRASGNEERAQKLFQECLQGFTELGDFDGLAWTMNHLARMERGAGRAAEARELLTKSLSLFENTGDHVGMANCLSDLAVIASKESDFETARAYLGRGLLVARREGLRRSFARLADVGCTVAAAEGNSESALRLAGSVDSFRKSSGFPRPQVERIDLEVTLSQARSSLGESKAEAAWRDGRTMSIDDAIEAALAIPPSTGR
jgi:predicted ATPase